MRCLSTVAVAAWLMASCGLTYQERQDRFRERYLAGCQVIRDPVAKTADPQQPASKEAQEQEQAEIDDVISGTKAEVEQCYLESRELWADLEGLVAIKFKVEANGSVKDPAVVMYDATIDEAAVGCCITRIAQNWKFPARTDGKAIEVEHTFDLVTDFFRLSFRPASDVGKPQPASGTEIHHAW